MINGGIVIILMFGSLKKQTTTLMLICQSFYKNGEDIINRLLMLLIIIIKFNLVLCDEAPFWSPYKVFSQNKKYFCWVDYNKNDTSKHSWNKKWLLKVFKSDSTFIWQKDFQFTGNTGGFLSDEGNKFVFVEEWYPYNAKAVTILNSDRPNIYYTGQDFHIPKLFLKQTASHELWLGGYTIENGHLIINTLDGRTWSINIDNGKMQLIELNLNVKNGLMITMLILFLTFSFIIIKKIMKRIKNN